LGGEVGEWGKSRAAANRDGHSHSRGVGTWGPVKRKQPSSVQTPLQASFFPAKEEGTKCQHQGGVRDQCQSSGKESKKPILFSEQERRGGVFWGEGGEKKKTTPKFFTVQGPKKNRFLQSRSLEKIFWENNTQSAKSRVEKGVRESDFSLEKESEGQV